MFLNSLTKTPYRRHLQEHFLPVTGIMKGSLTIKFSNFHPTLFQNIAMPFISATRLRIRSFRFMPAFILHTFRSSRQLVKAPGFLNGKTLVDRKLVFWTLTSWADEASMRAYRNSGAHKAAMPKLQYWCDEASVAHWQQETAGLPTWPDTHQQMLKGRISKVRHPSPDHLSMQIAAPRYPSKMEGSFKPQK